MRPAGAEGAPPRFPPTAGAHPEDEIEDEEQVLDALGAALHPHGGASGGACGARAGPGRRGAGSRGSGERPGARAAAEGRGRRRELEDECRGAPGRARSPLQPLRARSLVGRARRPRYFYGAEAPPPGGPAPGPASSRRAAALRHRGRASGSWGRRDPGPWRAVLGALRAPKGVRPGTGRQPGSPGENLSISLCRQRLFET